MPMEIVSVNLGEIQHYSQWKKTASSAIHKHPVEKARLSATGFQGDAQADLQNHGGEEKAVLCLPESAYARFAVNQPFGFLGENLTLAGIDETEVFLGQQFKVGEVVLEVSQPRSPCWKLNEHTGDKTFLIHYAKSGHVGFYCRVLQTGDIHKGMKIESNLPQNLPGLAIKDLFLAKLNPKQPASKMVLEQAFQHPALSQAWRAEIDKLLKVSANTKRG